MAGSPQAPQIIDHDQQPGTSAVHSNTQSVSKAKHLIFLSHSGRDKPFVRKLYDALLGAGHDPFFDTHSLPPGEPFPQHIVQNARNCMLGVVVLSPDFLTSRWPMMELHIMYTSLSRPTILPLFFKVSPDDIKISSPRFDEWRSAWRTHATESSSSRVNLSEWEDATKKLAILNGVIYNPDEGEEVFIRKAIHCICRVVRPPLRYMVSHLTGCDRLTQEVDTLFEEIPLSSHFQARTLGLHGIGGQGKTTICKLMVNHYAAAYAGRCSLIEFPGLIGEYQEDHVLHQCKKALQQLTNVHRERHIDDLDQCLQLLKDGVTDLSVFIVIDNIWENHLEWAQRIVDVGFNGESKILVTSRSAQVLISLLKDSKNVRELPSINPEEAQQIFLNSFHRNQQGDGVQLEKSEMDRMLRSFRPKHQYHPLTIHTLGALLGRTDRRGWPERWNEVHKLLQSDDSRVTKVIRINYDSLPETRRKLFLDVALMIHILDTQGHPPTRTTCAIWAEEDGCSNVDDNFDHLRTWLSALYDGRMEEWEIIRTLKQLTFDGLLEFEDHFGCGHEEVRVHDLYIELAIQEGAKSGKFMVGQKNLTDTTNMMNTEVERIVVEGNEPLRPEALPKLGLLVARDHSCDEWKLELMPALRILKIWKRNRNVNESAIEGWRNTPHLKWLELKAVTCEDISELCNLLVLKLQSCRLIMSGSQLDLNRLGDLQFLKISRVKKLEEIMGLGSLTNLKSMTLTELPHLRKVGTFSGNSTQLQVLEIELCGMLEDVQGLGLLPNLKALSCSQDVLCKEPCQMFGGSLVALSLTNVKDAQPNLRDMSALEALYLDYEGGRTVMGIDRGLAEKAKLKMLSLRGMIKGIGDIGQLPNLERILIYCCDGLKEIQWSSFHGLINLREIEIHDCRNLRCIKGDSSRIAPTFKSLVVDKCRNLKKVVTVGSSELTMCWSACYFGGK